MLIDYWNAMLDYEIVYRNLTVETKDAIFKLWENVLPDTVKKQRIEQVFAIAKNNQGNLVGVSTAYLDVLETFGTYYFIRVFVHPAYRDRLISRRGSNFIQLAKTKLREYPNQDQSPAGIVLELENNKISSKLMQSFDLTYYGIRSGRPTWYYNFK